MKLILRQKLWKPLWICRRAGTGWFSTRNRNRGWKRGYSVCSSPSNVRSQCRDHNSAHSTGLVLFSILTVEQVSFFTFFLYFDLKFVFEFETLVEKCFSFFTFLIALAEIWKERFSTYTRIFFWYFSSSTYYKPFYCKTLRNGNNKSPWEFIVIRSIFHPFLNVPLSPFSSVFHSFQHACFLHL